MAKRYYLCDIVGDGSEDNPFRPAVADYNVSYVMACDSDATGRPIHADAMVLVNAEDHAQLRGKPGIDPMPDFALDGKMSAINNVVRTQMINALRRRGIDDSGIGNTDGYREALAQIGMQRAAAFNIDSFDVN